MVFSNLQNHEKTAFFSLLDEYFASRPDVFGAAAGSSSSRSHSSSAGADPSSAAASAIYRGLAANPEATSRLVSAGLKHGVPKSSPYSAAREQASDPEVSNAAGRVAAASLAFSARNSDSSPPPQRSGPPIAEKPSGPGGLFSVKKFGDVDMSSKRNMIGSLYSGNKKEPEPAPPPAPAFAAAKNTFAPPPVRRVAAAPARAPSPPQREEPPQEEAQGEWADALYDYDSGEAGDLAIKEGQRVLVTERTSDDWCGPAFHFLDIWVVVNWFFLLCRWTGEYNGRKGLFPASYVKIL
ncbi:hypothetical protein H0H81_007839 [Sphagnurus paluster]|uniref:SH3 domain-containing protein n=1 Tax=Sphagnurus paluster TaxID=117069 RepID=A0A9P7GNC1_9AGAR|nr:hypothetical protein H0H81_007839 [Sphagnurus paluster]